MGIRDFFGLGQDDGDRSLIEVSNDSGDHIVIDVPTDEVGKVNRTLRKAGVRYDRDEPNSRFWNEHPKIEGRDPDEYRSRSTRVVDQTEDLEDSHDAEAEPWWGGFW